MAQGNESLIKALGEVDPINPSHAEPEVRGTFLSLVFICILEEKEGLRGKWFAVDNLPKNTVRGHRTKIIPCALGAFLADNANI